MSFYRSGMVEIGVTGTCQWDMEHFEYLSRRGLKQACDFTHSFVTTYFLTRQPARKSIGVMDGDVNVTLFYS